MIFLHSLLKKDFAQKRRFSILKGDLVLGLPTWNKWDDPVHFEKYQFVCFQQNKFVGKLVLPMAKRGGHPN